MGIKSNLIIIGREESLAKPLLDLLVPYLDHLSSGTGKCAWEVLPIPLIDTVALSPPLLPPIKATSPIYLFTSPRSVHFFFAQYKLSNECKVVSIGQATTQALSEEGVVANMTSKIESSEGMLPQLLEWIKTLYTKQDTIEVIQPTSTIAGTYLKEGLERVGITYHQVPLYDVVPHPHLSSRLEALPHPPKMAIFYSPSGVRAWCSTTSWRSNAISVGPVTTSALQQAGFTDIVESETPAPRALFTAIKMSINNKTK